MLKPTFTHLPSVPTTLSALMQRPMPDVLNYESQMLPVLRHWRDYEIGFQQMILAQPGTLYAVANFNLPFLEPAWCRKRINEFDMKLSSLLLGKNWSKTPPSDRYQFIAVPECAQFLHFNVVFNVPITHQERFWFKAPRVWKDVVPSGDLHLQVIGDEDVEHLKVRMYSAKTFHPGWTIEHLVSSTELRRKRK
jgi:hypothetical protein